MVGWAIWQETLELADAAARDQFLNTIVVSRSRVLADTATYRAAPWFERMAVRIPQVKSGWYVNYNSPPA